MTAAEREHTIDEEIDNLLGGEVRSVLFIERLVTERDALREELETVRADAQYLYSVICGFIRERDTLCAELLKGEQALQELLSLSARYVTQLSQLGGGRERT